MRRLSLLMLLIVPTAALADSWTVDFEDLTLAPQSYHNGMPANPVPGVTYDGSFTSRDAYFNNEFRRDDYGGGFIFDSWSGWSYSNRTDTTTAGFGNQYSSYAGGGLEGPGSNFGVAFVSSQVSSAIVPPTSYIDLPEVSFAPDAMELYLTNTTYTALSMEFGDSFAKEFGGPTGDDPDYLKLTILGYSGLGATGALVGIPVDFYLADYRSTDDALDYIVDTWERVDLTSLVGARSLGFRLDSTDRSQFGGPGSPIYLNTPTYFALDGLTLFGPTAVPEPSSLALVGSGLLGLLTLSRRRLA